MPGSLGHIFNAATAFRNLVRLCGIGGEFILRNMYLLYGLATGSGQYALARRCERKIDVETLLQEQPA
jgi:hypothetical protein